MPSLSACQGQTTRGHVWMEHRCIQNDAEMRHVFACNNSRFGKNVELDYVRSHLPPSEWEVKAYIAICAHNKGLYAKLVQVALRKLWYWWGEVYINLFHPLSSMAPLTGDLGPLGGAVVIACFRSASVGKWTRSPLNLLSACFLTIAKYTGALCSARAQKYAGADIKRVLSKFLSMAFSATDVLPAWQRVLFSWMLWSSRNGEEKLERETKLHECGPLSQSVIKGQLHGDRTIVMVFLFKKVWLQVFIPYLHIYHGLRNLPSHHNVKNKLYCNIFDRRDNVLILIIQFSIN